MVLFVYRDVVYLHCADNPGDEVCREVSVDPINSANTGRGIP